MSSPIASPGAMWARLVAGGLPVAVVMALSAMVVGPMGLARAKGAWSPWAAWSLALSGVVVGVVMGAAVVVVRRTRLLHRSVARAHASGHGEGPPPSEAALRDAFDTPRWMAWSTGLVLMGAWAVQALLSSSPVGAPAMALLVAGAWLVGVLPAAYLWQRAMWVWLREVSPSDVPLGVRQTVAMPVMLAVGAPLSGVMLIGVAVLLAHGALRQDVGLGTWVGLALGSLAPCLVGVAWGRREGQRVARDLRRLGERVAALGRDPASAATLGTSAVRTREADVLARRVLALAERHARSLAEEAEARRAIEEVQRLKSRFMAYVSHDLRSPLNSIKGFAEILARETDGPLEPSQQESVEMIRQAGDDLLRLVNDILDSAKLEAGRLVLRRAWIPSVEILTEAVRQARALIGARAIDIVTELEPGLPPVQVDRDRVVQAVVGILAHVVRMLHEGTIRLRARVIAEEAGEGGHLRVEVIDDGASLEEEDRARLFEAFRAVREPSGRRIGGLGLGLSLARGLIVAHGGDVWYERRDRGEQAPVTAFCVSLPLTLGHGA